MAIEEKKLKMKTSKITYNPSLSVKDNAMKNGVSVAAIRYYIRTNGIDRRYDSQLAKYKAIKELKDTNPNISNKEISLTLHISINTVKKYMSMDYFQLKSDSLKLSTFDISKRKFIIKSTSYNQDEILNNILHLYIKKETFDIDLTASTCVFYKQIPKPKLLFDKYPQQDNIMPLTKAYQLKSDTYHSVILDLPFIVKDKKSAATSMIAQRFNSFLTIEELYTTNTEMMELAFHLLRKGGYLVMKTMDFCYGNKQYWISNFVQNKAIEMKFKLIDTFVLIAKNKILTTRGEKQRYARKFHSYFYVFKKT